MKTFNKTPLALALGLALSGGAGQVSAAINIQCPGDTGSPGANPTEKDAVVDTPDPNHPNATCLHLVGGDGFVTMANDADIDGDGRPGRRLYQFGFSDNTGVKESNVLNAGVFSANFSAPTITLDQGQEFFLNLSNVGTMNRPDLFDPHTVHFHGFPNASVIFDGVPEGSVSIGQGNTLTYYYNLKQPGTFMYHCHVEATEHMQMGMLGNLYVRPAQNGSSLGSCDGGPCTQFVYNDGDGSTGYDVEFPIQIGSWDSAFHDASEATQPLPFADMNDDYPMLNGRGYPDTANMATFGFAETPGSGANPLNPGVAEQVASLGSSTLTTSQPVSSLITATAGQKVLLRMSNLNVTRFYTLATNLGVPMKVVGAGAEQMKGNTGLDISFDTTTVTLGGGEAADVIIDTTGVAPGTYFLYATNLNYLSNADEDFGGMMTQIDINP